MFWRRYFRGMQEQMTMDVAMIEEENLGIDDLTHLHVIDLITPH
jgi:hypothetical protein